MARSSRSSKGRIAGLTAILVVASACVGVLWPGIFETTAASNAATTDNPTTVFPNYDIRTDQRAIADLKALRSAAGQPSITAEIRARMAEGERKLREKIPTLETVVNEDLRIPEVIAPDVELGRKLLTGRSSKSRTHILREFLTENADLVGTRPEQVSELKIRADYTNPSGNLSFVELTQDIDGIPVFRGEVKAAFTRDGEIIRVINNLAPIASRGASSKDFGQPRAAVDAAAATIGIRIDPAENARASNDRVVIFGDGDFATKAEKTYFPLDVGLLRPAWRVLLWGPSHAYYVVVDAETLTVLWRKNITDDQTQPATYNVFANPNAMVNIARSPFPFAPGPQSPNGQQGSAAPRTPVTRVGNEPPYTFNDLGWITDGGNTTDGNNVQAGLDRDLPNSGAPANPNDIDPNGIAVGSPERVFAFAANPARPSNPVLGEGDQPLPAGEMPTVCRQPGMGAPMTDFQKASVTTLFYIVNVFHDEMYRLGFTEQAGNFQHDNFERGGLGGDRVSAQAQDCSGSNNATFSTPTDGTRPQMQMQLWTQPAPDVDGSFDADLVIHEAAHGVSQRLHGNSLGLFIDFSRGMGEGWSDFYAACLLSEPGEPVDGVYPTAAYSTYRHVNAGLNNYYYGLRRFPKAVMSSTGGPQNRPHNPLTFADIDSTTMDLSDGAFQPNFVGNADQVHGIGEVWSSALWEVRARFITRLGWAEGNRRILQFVTDGMKLSPLSPNFITGRDAIVAAAQASGTAEDVADIWAGFAVRGIGAGAAVMHLGGTSTGGINAIRVAEAFDLPNLRQAPDIKVSDDTGDNDGYAEPGETVRLTIPLSNSTGRTATTINMTIPGAGSADYGDLPSGQVRSRDFTFTIPASASCGSRITLILDLTSSLGTTTFMRQFYVGKGLALSSSETFDGSVTSDLPAGWTVTVSAGAVPFATTTQSADTAPNSIFAASPSSIGGGTDLTSPPIDVTMPNASVTFRNRFETESGWDGGVLEISIDGSAYQDILSAGGSFAKDGYTGTLGPGFNNPLAGRSAWTGDSNGYVTTVVGLPAAAHNKIIHLRWRFGADNNTAVAGWNVDTINLSGAGFVSSFACAIAPDLGARADFDGDGRTDPSVFRPQDGNWWQDRSSLGITAQVWGLNGDTPVPGDYDGDGKADLAVFRGKSAAGAAQFYVFNSLTSSFTSLGWGLPDDIPVVGDFDGDRRADHSVWRPSNGIWYALLSTGGFRVTPFGSTGDLPVALDVDGDGAANFAVYRPSDGRWFIARPGSSVPDILQFGVAGDRPVPADYDGDNIDDLAVFRVAEGRWYIRSSRTGTTFSVTFGQSGDVPVPGDYDGDGKDDPAVYRDGMWFVSTSASGVRVFRFGTATDIPIPSKYLP